MTIRIPKIVLALAAAVLPAAAQEALGPSPTPTAAVAPSNPPAPKAPDKDTSQLLLAPHAPQPVLTRSSDSDANLRSVSPGIAAALADGLPKYNPPTPTPRDDTDLRDVDKPKNEIPRLPKYVVREPRPPVFSNRELYTDVGQVSLMFNAHPGLGIGNVLGLNSGVASEMFNEQQRLDDINDLADTARAIARGGDRKEALEIMQDTKDAYMQSSPDTSWSGPGSSPSNDAYMQTSPAWSWGGSGGGGK